MKLTLNQEAVIAYLRSKPDLWVSPTEIGNYVGGLSSGGLPRHSAWASPICKKLVTLNLAERNERGFYKAR